MAHYANQKTFIIHRENALTSGKQYLAIECETLANAARDLSPIGFKLYCYLCSNKDGFTKDYSPQDFANIYGVSIDSARKAPANLIECGYLVGNEQRFEFYEKPQEKAAAFDVEPFIEKRLIRLQDGSFKAVTLKELLEDEYLKAHLTEEQITNLLWAKAEVAKNG